VSGAVVEVEAIGRGDAVCANCRMYQPGGQTRADGSCRRYPPRLIVDHVAKEDDRPIWQYNHNEKWPAVNADEWCGEFVSNEPTARELLGVRR
jgi:hypothetical protein